MTGVLSTVPLGSTEHALQKLPYWEEWEQAFQALLEVEQAIPCLCCWVEQPFSCRCFLGWSRPTVRI